MRGHESGDKQERQDSGMQRPGEGEGEGEGDSGSSYGCTMGGGGERRFVTACLSLAR